MKRPSTSPRGTSITRGLAIGAMLALTVLLTWGVFHLFSLRYARGDIYPPYSTLRADPLGSKALFDALDAMTRVDATRNFRPLERLNPEQPVTLIYVGLPFGARWRDTELRHFESLVTSGTRAVFAFQREFKTTDTERLSTPRKKAASASPTPTGSPTPARKGTQADTKEAPGVEFREVAARWDFAFDIAQDEEREVVNGVAEREGDAGDLEPTVPWHSALYFKGITSKWRVLYRCNGVPVVIERDFGRGSIVLASDSFFLSNEALRTARAPKLIAHLLGAASTVVFDEEHHGVTEDANIAGLARKHGLGGAMWAIVLVLGLFLWKSALPFLPPRPHLSESDAEVSGTDTAEGFVNLLRRSIPVGRVLQTCVDEWRKSRGRHLRAEESAFIDSVLGAQPSKLGSTRDAVAAYRTIADRLRRNPPRL